MLYFKTRAKRNEWNKEHDSRYNLVDMGAEAPKGRRWAVRVL